MKKIAFTFLFPFALYGAITRQGKVYELGTHHQDVLYEYQETISTTPAGEVIQTQFRTLKDKKLAVQEKVEFAKNKALKSYTIHRPLEGVTNVLTVTKGKGSYQSRSLKSGAVEASEEDWDDGQLVVPQLQAYALQHWDKILAGDTIHFRIAIPEKMQSYGFKIFLDGESKTDGREVVNLKVKPSSFFIAMVIDAFVLQVDKSTRQLVRLSGPSSLPRVHPGPNELRDIESDLVYLQKVRPSF